MSAFYDLASLVLVPSGYKASKVYAQKPLTTDGQLTFSRASTATRVNSAGLIETVSSNVPRLDYTNSTCPKLLLEPQRTNLQIYSQDFRNVAEGGATNTWTPNDTVILSTNNEAPDGTLTATRIRGTSGANKARQAVIFGTAGAPYSGSIYIRRVSGTQNITLRVGDVGTAIGINPTSTWQRFSHTVSPSTTTVRLGLVFPNDTDEFEIWGAMLEAGAYATSYLKTEASTVTRLADACSKTGISSLIGQTEGTLFVEFDFTATAAVGVKMQISGTQRVSIYSVGTSIVGNAAGTNLFGYTQGTNERLKIAFAYKSGSSALYVNGVQKGVSSNAFTLTSISDLFLSNNFGGSEKEIMPTYQALLFKTRLTNAQLAELTTL